MTNHSYNALNRLITTTYAADGVTVGYQYDAAGNRTLMVDDVGATSYEYDDFYRLITVTNPFNAVVGYRYDDVGNRTQLIYPDGREVDYSYDGDNRLVQAEDWNSDLTTYQYDGAGRLITTTLPNGVVSVNAYDDANRLTSLRHTAADSTVLAEYLYQLDGVGNRILVTETVRAPHAEQAIDAYIEQNCLLVLEAENGTATASGSHEWQTQTAQTGYGGSGYRRALSDVGARFEETETASSPSLSWSIYNETSDTYSVWVRGMAPDAGGDSLHVGLDGVVPGTAADLTGFTDAWSWSRVTPGGNAAIDLSTTGAHTLDAYMREDGLRVDRLLLVTDTNYIPSGLGPSESSLQTITATLPGPPGTTNITYGYDDLYRLTEAEYTGAITATYAYDYDPVGNMKAFTEMVGAQSSAVTRSYDAANRLEYAIDASGTTTYTYDANGNLIEVAEPQAWEGRLYTYDQRNLLTRVDLSLDPFDGNYTTYTYDGDGNRLQQDIYQSPGIIYKRTTQYANDVVGLTQVLMASEGVNNNPPTQHVYNLFGLDLISQDDDSEVRTLLVDGLGSVRTEMVDEVVETVTTYSPYGEVLVQDGLSGTEYGFTGEQEDGATGLLYLRARYYDSSLKTFMSRDPWEGTGWQPATLNYYTYVHGNPIKYADPSGNCIVAWSGEVRMNDYPYGTSGICPHSESPTTDYFWNEVAKPSPSFSSLLARLNGNGLAALIYYFRVDQHGPASLRLENLLNETEQLRFMGINFKSAVQFGIRIPGGAALCEDFEDKQYYAAVGGYPEWQEVDLGADAQMSHFLTAVALAYYSVDGSPFLGAGLARLSTGLDPVVRGTSSTSFSEFRNMSNAELAIRLIVGHEVIPDRAGVIGNRSANVEQLLATDEQQVRGFIQAVAHDVAGDESQRDALLNRILSSNPDSIAIRPGNSLEDLRLSVKGWIFGHDIAVQLISTSNQAAAWLESNLSR